MCLHSSNNCVCACIQPATVYAIIIHREPGPQHSLSPRGNRQQSHSESECCELLQVASMKQLWPNTYTTLLLTRSHMHVNLRSTKVAHAARTSTHKHTSGAQWFALYTPALIRLCLECCAWLRACLRQRREECVCSTSWSGFAYPTADIEAGNYASESH